MRLFRSSEILGIAREPLDFALEASEATHPNEYMCLLRGEDARKFDLERSGQIITVVLATPGHEPELRTATVKPYTIVYRCKSIGSFATNPTGM